MKPILMFMSKTCPHSQRAFKWMDDVKQEHPEYKDLDITMVDEREEPDRCAKYDYYFIPTYYVDGKKVHEGACSKEIVEQVFADAYNG